MSRTRTSTLTWFSVLLMVCCLGNAIAAPSQAIDALQLVVDPVTGSSALDSLAIGETVKVSAVVDRLSAGSLQSFQIGLDYDSSLVPVGVKLHPNSGAVLKPTLADVYVGLSTLLLAAQGPHILATWTFTRLPGFAADHPAIIRLRSLENGEPSLYRSMSPGYHLAEFRDVGAVRIGSPSPGLWRYLCTARDFVEGRSYDIEWESSGLSDLELDGVLVEESGRRSYVAGETAEHILRYQDASGPHERRLTVDALREPRFEYLTVLDPPTPESTLYRVQWSIEGATSVWWDPGPDFVSYRGERGVSTTGPAAVTLRAQNEWGETVRTVVIRSTGEPSIVAYRSEDAAIYLGDQTRLSWSVAEAQSATLTPPGIEVPVNGSEVVAPESTTTYVLRATDGTASIERALQVEVVTLQIKGFGATPTSVYPDSALTLGWSVVNADSIWIEPDVGSVESQSGSILATPTEPDMEYTLHALRGSVELTQKTYCEWKPPRITVLSISHWPIDIDDLFTFHVEIEHADSAWFQPLGVEIYPPNEPAYITASATQPQVFSVYAYNRGGMSVREYEYAPHRPQIWMHESSHRPSAALGRWATVTIRTNNSDRVEITAPSILPAPYVEERPISRFINLAFWLDQPALFVAKADNRLYSIVDSLAVGVGETPFAELTVDEPILARGDSTTIRWRVLNSYLYWSDTTLQPVGVFFHEGLHGAREGSYVIHPDATTQYEMIFSHFSTSSRAKYRALATVQVVDGETSLVAEPMKPGLGSVFDLRIAMPPDATSAMIEPDIGNIEPHNQTIQQIAGDRRTFRLQVTTPSGIQQAMVLVEPEGVAVVPSMVTSLELTGHARGSAVVLGWNVQTLRPAESLRIERVREGSAPEVWRTLNQSQGEIVDAEVEAGRSYTYWVRFEIEGESYQSEAVVVRPAGVVQTRMLPNIPNPFNPSTRIRWDLAEKGGARLEIYDLRGRRLRTADLGTLEAGTGSWTWDGRDDTGHRVASGAYVVRLESGVRALSQKVVLAK